LKKTKSKTRLYLDNCSFNRPFDDQSQLKIRLETEAKIAIQKQIIKGKFDLVWSYILDYENLQNPYEERKSSIHQWSDQALVVQKESKSVIQKAEQYKKQGLKSKDALHIACAIESKCDYFITTDDHIISKMDDDKLIQVLNPLNFIQIEET
jgi:predicted nucleic acid-binding protein